MQPKYRIHHGADGWTSPYEWVDGKWRNRKEEWGKGFKTLVLRSIARQLGKNVSDLEEGVDYVETFAKRRKPSFPFLETPFPESDDRSCAVCALASVTGISWKAANDFALSREAREPNKGTFMRRLLREAYDGPAEILGKRFTRFTPTQQSAPRHVSCSDDNLVGSSGRYRSPTLSQFLKSHPTGMYLAVSKNHAFVVWDGTVCDTCKNLVSSRTRIVECFAVEDIK